MLDSVAFVRKIDRNFRIALVLTGIALMSPKAGATELFDTLPTPLADTNLGYGSLSNSSIAYAQSFSTTAQDFVITGVTLRLSTNASSGSFRVSIYGFDTSTNAPSSSLFSSTIFEGFPTGVTFAGADVAFPVSDLVLEPSKRYYVVASHSNITPGLAWGDSQNNRAVGTNFANEYYAGSNTSGTTWAFVPPVQSNIAPFIMRVTAVPEVSPMIAGSLAAAFLAVLGAIRKQTRPGTSCHRHKASSTPA